MDLKEQAAHTVILISRGGMGQAKEELQQKLIKTYLRLLKEAEVLPAVICFYAEGVRLVLADSPVLEELRALEKAGVHLVLCGTCLNYFDAADQVAVGVVGGMTDIIEAQFQARRVITL